MKYVLDKVCKHSVRYRAAVPNKTMGPVTVYIPNEMFTDPSHPPVSIAMSVTVPG